jgi:hypothetical protein
MRQALHRRHQGRRRMNNREKGTYPIIIRPIIVREDKEEMK